METAIKTDVIIVGAGPTGLSLGCQLIRYGVDFIIFDEKEGITPYSKALAVHARTLEIYEQIGLAERAVAEGNVAGKIRLLEGGEIRGEIDLSNVGHGLSQYPFMLVFEQSKNERLLDEYLQAHGKDVLWQTKFESFTQNDESVTAQVVGADGETRSVEAKYLVGCDGPKSPTRHALELKFEGITFERVFYVADVKIDWQYGHDALHVCLAENTFVVFFPMSGENCYRIVGAFPEDFNKDEGNIFYEEIERRIKEESKIELDITEVNWFSTYKVHTRHVEKFQSGRCFLAGDAAHVHTPAGGQGMNTGIQDAYNLAWKLAFVLQDKADAKILETYDTERLENAKNLLKTTDRMFNLAAGTDWFFNLIRTTVFPPMAKYILAFDAVKKRLFPTISQIGINYRQHALSKGGEGNFTVKAGDRMPYFLADDASIYNRLREPKFHLLAFTDGTGDYQTLKTEVENTYKDLIDFHIVPIYPHVAEIFETDESFSVLLRPDNYIAFISEENALDDLKTYMREIVGFNKNTAPKISPD